MKERDFSLILVAQGQEMVVDLCCFFCFGKSGLTVQEAMGVLG